MTFPRTLGESHQMQVVWEAPPADFALSIRFIRCVAPSTKWSRANLPGVKIEFPTTIPAGILGLC